MRKKLMTNVTLAGVLAGFMLFGWGSPSLITELKKENQRLKVKVGTLEEKVKTQQKMIGELSEAGSELNDDLYKVCQLGRKMAALGFSPEYEQLRSLVTQIIKKRGYKIRGQKQEG